MVGGEGGASEGGEGSDTEGGGGCMSISEAVREERQQGWPQERSGDKTVRVLGDLDFGDHEKSQKKDRACFQDEEWAT